MIEFFISFWVNNPFMCFPAEDSGFLVYGTLGVSCCAEGQYTADVLEWGRDKSRYGYEG